MTSTYTTDLRLTKQGTGDNSGTWGVVANNVFQLIEDSIAGIVSVNISAAGDYTLSTANGATDEARNMILRMGGSPAAAKNVVIPAVSKLYVAECTIGTAVTITVKTNTGIGVNLIAGQKNLIYCDGLNTYSVLPTLLDLGITATAGEINILDGATVTVGELNILDGATLSTSELNILDGATVTVGELNILDGATLSTSELNLLDGVTATTAEFNYLDGVTSNIQTQFSTLSSGLPIITNTSSGKAVLGAITIQWGYSPSATHPTVTFPTAFSGIPYSVVGTAENLGATSNPSNGITISTRTVSTFTAFTFNTGGQGAAACAFFWTAIGPT